MRSRAAAFLLLLLSVGCAAPATAQAPFQVTIGSSVVALTGPWRFHPGDDPGWARADLDDSAWTEMDLTPADGSLNPSFGSSGFVPGWTAKGFPKLTRFAWYRLRVQVRSDGAGGLPPALSLKMPEDFDDAYQVFVDGRLVGEFGRFEGDRVTFYNSQPRAFSLPDAANGRPFTLAIRMWMDPGTPFWTQDAGGMHASPLLGQAAAIDSMLRLDWDDIDRYQADLILMLPLLFFAAGLGLALFLLDRREPAFLWLSLAVTSHLVPTALVLAGYYTAWVPAAVQNFLLDVVLTPVQFGLWLVFWGSWFGLEEIRPVRRIGWGLVLLLVATMAMFRQPLYGLYIPAAASAWLLPASLVLRLALGAMIFWVVYRGIRTRGAEGWLALPAVAPGFFHMYEAEMRVLHIPAVMRVFGLLVSVGDIALLLTLAAVSLLMVRRFLSGLREREQLRQEMEHARQVQAVLIPDALPEVAGFSIQSEYFPARQVGGDFFQILPLAGGGVLVVIGDVSGKGIPAAMTVSLLVGTASSIVQYTQRPGELLAAMNQRMIGRSQGGFTTCLAARIDACGRMTAANAGHLAPYVNGQEIEMENNLPLGLAAGTEYPEIVAQLPEGAQLTLLTDGVVEARSRTGELFGFERTAAISTQSAGEIADRAREFGQQDDITVLTIVRVAARQGEAAPAAPALGEPG